MLYRALVDENLCMRDLLACAVRDKAAIMVCPVLTSDGELQMFLVVGLVVG